MALRQHNLAELDSMTEQNPNSRPSEIQPQSSWRELPHSAVVLDANLHEPRQTATTPRTSNVMPDWNRTHNPK